MALIPTMTHSKNTIKADLGTTIPSTPARPPINEIELPGCATKKLDDSGDTSMVYNYGIAYRFVVYSS